MPQLDHALAQLLLRLERSVDLLALAMPALHRQIELRRLQARDSEVARQARPVERLQSLAQAPPWARKHRDLIGEDRALPGRRLLAQLVDQILALVANAEQQQRDDSGGERSGHDQRPQVDLDQTKDRVLNREEVYPRVPREVARDGNDEAGHDRKDFPAHGRQLARDADARPDVGGVCRVAEEKTQHLAAVPLNPGGNPNLTFG